MLLKSIKHVIDFGGVGRQHNWSRIGGKGYTTSSTETSWEPV